MYHSHISHGIFISRKILILLLKDNKCSILEVSGSKKFFCGGGQNKGEVDQKDSTFSSYAEFS